MKILIADKVSPDMIKAFEEAGAEVAYDADLSAESLPEAIGDTAILVVRSTKVTADTIAAGTHLRLIVRAGAGVNTIALDAASDRGVYVANCPGMNTDAVAELAVGLLIAADRRIPDATLALREGKWLKSEFGKAHGLLGRTLGIIGLGQIGLATAKRAQAMGMQVIAWSRSLTPERAEELDFEYAATPLEVARSAYAVSVHLASTPETKHMINGDFFAAMAENSILVNASRGDVVDTEALVKAIDQKGIRAALDVYEDEPSGGKAEFPHTELAGKVICTPHIGASTDQASQAIADEAVRIVTQFMRTGLAENVVNMRPPAEDKTHLLVRHYNQVGVLAGVLNPLRDQGINIEEMQNEVFQTGTAACCTLTLDSQPTEDTLEKVRAVEGVIAVEL